MLNISKKEFLKCKTVQNLIDLTGYNIETGKFTKLSYSKEDEKNSFYLQIVRYVLERYSKNENLRKAELNSVLIPLRRKNETEDIRVFFEKGRERNILYIELPYDKAFSAYETWENYYNGEILKSEDKKIIDLIKAAYSAGSKECMYVLDSGLKIYVFEIGNKNYFVRFFKDGYFVIEINSPLKEKLLNKNWIQAYKDVLIEKIRNKYFEYFMVFEDFKERVGISEKITNEELEKLWYDELL